jgi:hypothetical protein
VGHVVHVILETWVSRRRARRSSSGTNVRAWRCESRAESTLTWSHPHLDLGLQQRLAALGRRGPQPSGRDVIGRQRNGVLGVSRRCDGTSPSGSRRRRIAARSIVVGQAGMRRPRATVQSTNAWRGVMGETTIGEEFITHAFAAVQIAGANA